MPHFLVYGQEEPYLFMGPEIDVWRQRLGRELIVCPLKHLVDVLAQIPPHNSACLVVPVEKHSPHLDALLSLIPAGVAAQFLVPENDDEYDLETLLNTLNNFVRQRPIERRVLKAYDHPQSYYYKGWSHPRSIDPIKLLEWPRGANHVWLPKRLQDKPASGVVLNADKAQKDFAFHVGERLQALAQPGAHDMPQRHDYLHHHAPDQLAARRFNKLAMRGNYPEKLWTKIEESTRSLEVIVHPWSIKVSVPHYGADHTFRLCAYGERYKRLPSAAMHKAVCVMLASILMTEQGLVPVELVQQRLQKYFGRRLPSGTFKNNWNIARACLDDLGPHHLRKTLCLTDANGPIIPQRNRRLKRRKPTF